MTLLHGKQVFYHSLGFDSHSNRTFLLLICIFLKFSLTDNAGISLTDNDDDADADIISSAKRSL